MNSIAFDDTISSCVPNRTTIFSSPETTIDCTEKNDKRRGNGRDYEFHSSYENKAKAKDVLKNEFENSLWTQKDTKKMKNGDKIYYVCRNKYCPKRLYIYLQVPSHNNALEATNRVIKESGKLRQRLALSQFLNVVTQDLIRDWSLSRNPTNINCHHYAHEPKISLELWTEAYQWNTLAKQIQKIDLNGDIIYLTSATETNVSKSECKSYLVSMNELLFDCFDKFMKYKNSIIMININKNN
jgi:hypothetical protein